jgi:hypothetical protein
MVMNFNQIKYQPNEDVLFDSQNLIITNKSIYVCNISKSVWDHVNISDTLPPEAKNGGKPRRKNVGFKLLGSGSALIAVQVLPYLLYRTNILANFGSLIESLYFLISMALVSAGTYFLLGSYLTPPPHTAVLIPCLKRKKDIVISFKGWDSSEVKELNRQYRRAKRIL